MTGILAAPDPDRHGFCYCNRAFSGVVSLNPNLDRGGKGGMPERHRFPWITLLLLVAPLACLATWLAVGGIQGSFGPDFSPAPGTEKPAPAGAPASFLSGFPAPEADYPADRLFERVDGAADALIAAGCGRLLFWRMKEPAAEMEVLVFDRAEGAASVLGKDSGPGRDPGPGEEASVTDQSVFFRRGRYYVRILGDPTANPGREKLLELAGRADRGLPASGTGSPTASLIPGARTP